MKNRNIAFLITILCLLSLVVGILNNSRISRNLARQDENGVKQIQKMFAASGDKIALIRLDGPISSDGSAGFISSFYSAEGIKKALIKTIDDKTVKGVILRTNTPGGTVGLSQEIYHTILRLRQEKPVILSMEDITASGGYYIAAAADRIFAQEGTLTGSIGVIMSAIDAHQLLTQKLGITNNTIKSGKFKDIASPYKQMTEDERELLQNIINSTYEQFVGAIIKGRVERNDKYTAKKTALTEEELRKYADGRIFTGEQAKKLGFVDDLGGLYEATLTMNKMIEEKFSITKELPVVPYNSPTNFETLFLGVDSLFPGEIFKSVTPLSTRMSRQPLYLWE
ncbi:MAG: signal peptide peptidase SppA [Candidatus Gastranaerophilales bacterium]|nr:signal peptide peptidase SppA [Candidatus Gastranaerophilales bacterium]